MADTIFNINSCSSELEENPSTPDNSAQSPSSSILSDIKMSSTSSPKRSRRGMEKRVVAIPLKEAQGSSRLKGETPPPPDSWSWRKYGQKPIKGSPYPRGYYRCSTSKGCPARKQVERSRLDPTVLIVTYSSDHNHPPKNNLRNNKSVTPKTPESPEHSPPQPEAAEPDQPSCPIEKFTDPDKQALLMNDEYSWFNDMSCISQSAILESPVFTETTSVVGDGDGGARMQMREEDESLFADLEELPECSAVFRRSLEEERRHFTAEQWCGTAAKTG